MRRVQILNLFRILLFSLLNFSFSFYFIFFIYFILFVFTADIIIIIQFETSRACCMYRLNIHYKTKSMSHACSVLPLRAGLWAFLIIYKRPSRIFKRSTHKLLSILSASLTLQLCGIDSWKRHSMIISCGTNANRPTGFLLQKRTARISSKAPARSCERHNLEQTYHWLLVSNRDPPASIYSLHHRLLLLHLFNCTDSTQASTLRQTPATSAQILPARPSHFQSGTAPKKPKI